MIKSDLIDKIHKDMCKNVPKHIIKSVVNSFTNNITDALSTEGKVVIRNFGIWETNRVKSRIGRNPQKPSKTFRIPSKVRASFRAGKALKEALNKDT